MYRSLCVPCGLTSQRADLVGDGVAEDALLLDVHDEGPLHVHLQRLGAGAAAVVAAVAVRDVLLELEGEGLGAVLGRPHRELPHRGGGGHCGAQEERTGAALVSKRDWDTHTWTLT